MAPREESKVSKQAQPEIAEEQVANLPKYTWQQVAEHNSEQSAWVTIDGFVYDVTKFLDRHPGGKEMMLLASGRECTELFTSYHPFAEQPKAIMEKYKIGTMTGPSEFPLFPKDNGFYDTLRSRVKAHLQANKIDYKSPWRGLALMTPVMLLAAVTYSVICGYAGRDWSLSAKIAVAMFYGMLQVLPLMHHMHDGSHTAMGHSEGWWKVLGRGWNEVVAGGSTFSWQHQHVIGHHIYTNVFEADPDLPSIRDGDLRYLVPAQNWAWLYRFQHIYLPIIYGLLVVKIRISDILVNSFAGKNGPIRVNYYSSMFWRIYFMKALFVTHRFLLPIYYNQMPVWENLLLFLVSDYISGLYLAYNFQVSHITTHVSWPNGETAQDLQLKEEILKKDPYAVNMLTDSWAAVQVKTGLSYGHHSAWTTFFSAALNYQIEHHLFPSMSQYLYPEIAPIVKQTCKEFGIPYRYEESFTAAFKCHLRHLYEMGQKGKPVHMD